MLQSYQTITKYQTKDGVIHDTIKKAVDHVETKVFDFMKKVILDSLKDPNNQCYKESFGDGQTAWHIANEASAKLMEARKELFELLQEEKAFEVEEDEYANS